MYSNHRNRLGLEKSPYLLQHADNPVNWYPWGKEAFELAEKENKPVFLSIGYSTCHWCHVMAHESFEDAGVANLMNDIFISVKVDREERPDIDMVYMAVCQMVTGSGGWPLTIIMTPDKHPFFAGTYLPKETRFGQIGMLELIPRIKEIWTTKHDDILNSASQITSALKRMTLDSSGNELNESLLHIAYEQFEQRFDEQHGGFGEAPKFPMPHNLLFLLRYWKRTGEKRALEMVEKTLQEMRRGGIFDQIGFGFHRYSTDSRWLVPHFEKMLYDQALLAIAYLECYQATAKDEYARVAREILDYVLRDMTSPEGGFYSAEDADSEGEEGKFYLWTSDEIQGVLASEEAEIAYKTFDINRDGNFVCEAGKNGQNIPHMTQSIGRLASETGMSVSEYLRKVDIIRQKLFNWREKRVHPYKDDKILTDWNGLMIAAMAKGAQILDEPRFTAAGERTINFILKNLVSADGRLLHRYRDGTADISANFSDYAFLIYGLLELYEATFEAKYLRIALELNAFSIQNFWDDDGGGFYFTADDSENLLVRQKEVHDNAIPSGNSVAMLNLLRLGRITANIDFEEKAAKIGSAFYTVVSQLPSAFSQLMLALDFALGPSHEVTIAGESQSKEAKEMLRALRKKYVPNKIVILCPTEKNPPEIDSVIPFITNYESTEKKPTAYVCLKYNCKLPTADINTMLELLR